MKSSRAPGEFPRRGSEGTIRRVRVEKLAATGEGVARTAEGVGFIDRALPGELVETSIYERRTRFWRGAVREILEPSPHRVRGEHASCAGCDWAHFEAAEARRAKGELFLETMQRIGRLPRALFGEPSVSPSGAGYRLRTRLHVAGRGPDTRVGYFAPRTHRVVDASACEAIAVPTREASLTAIREAIAGAGARAFEAAILEDIAGRRRLLRVTAASSAAETAELSERLEDRFDGVRVRSPEGPILLDTGADRLDLDIGERRLLVSVDSFFQGNRHLVSELWADVEREARRVRAGEALDAFGGTGLFAGAMLSAGHRVTSVELDPGAIADARATRAAWPDRERWGIEASSIADFLRADERLFDLVVADPPRTGLGAELASVLARSTRELLLYVSCDPATLARDLSAIRAAGFEVRSTRLYDLFAFTHRIEALVALERLA